MMTWNDVNVYQWQRYVKLVSDLPKDVDELGMLDFNISLVSVMFNKSIYEVEAMTNLEFKSKLKELEFLNTEIPYNPKKYINADGNLYRLIYDVRKIRNAKQFIKSMSAGEIITIKQLSSDFIDNVHKIFACMVVPQKKILGIRFDKKYNPKEVEAYSEDILYAKIVDVHSTCLFFCRVFEAQIKSLLTFLAKDMKEEEQQKVADLVKTLDGFLTPQK